MSLRTVGYILGAAFAAWAWFEIIVDVYELWPGAAHLFG